MDHALIRCHTRLVPGLRRVAEGSRGSAWWTRRHGQLNTTDEKLVDELVRRLQAEHERAGQLDNDRVLRIAERRDAPPEVVSAVRRRLTEMGVLAGARKAAEVEGWSPPSSGDDEGRATGFDILSKYLDELGQYPLLVADEEVVLGRRIRAARERLTSIVESLPDSELGEQDFDRLFLRAATRRLPLDALDRRLLLDGADAEDQLYRSNLRLVVSIARRTYWTHQKLDPLDIIQAGNLGLVRAVQLFDHRLGYKFSTYATWWIRQAIDRHVADAGRTIRLPVHLMDSIRALRNARRALELELGREPTLREISDWTGDTPERVQFLDDVARTTASLDAPLANGSGATLGDLVPDEQSESPEEIIERRVLGEVILEALDDLSPREKEIIRLRYGLDDGRVRTLEDVGRMFRLTRERIRQIEAQALKKLRHPSRSTNLADFWVTHWVPVRTASSDVDISGPPAGTELSEDDRDGPPASTELSAEHAGLPPAGIGLSQEGRVSAATDRILDYASTLAEPAAIWALECASALLEGKDPPMTPNEPWAAHVYGKVSRIMGGLSGERSDDRAQARRAGQR
jgi:RNA polymerase primary sigma factor